MNAISFTRIGTFMKASKTKIAAVLLLIMLGIVLFPGKKLNAAEEKSGTCGDNVTWTLDDEGTLTISGSGAMSDTAFYQRTDIKKVVIESGVTSIGRSAFFSCTSLTSITIPDSVTSFGKDAFRNCTSLTKISLPNSVTSIEEAAFQSCKSLAEVSMPNSVTSIGDSAFVNCSSLKSITISNSVTSIGKEAFNFCPSLSSITIPASVTSIGKDAFRNCTKLSSITIKKSLYDQCKDAFPGISSGIFHFYDGTCGNNVFWTLDAEGTLTISGTGATKDYQTSDKSPFDHRTDIKKVVIESGVTSIGYGLFLYCSNLTEVSIPNSVTSIGAGAFYQCPSLKNITLPNSVTSIGTDAFGYCTSLTSIKIPNSVTSIGNFTFEYCTNLTNITISNSVTSIGTDAFGYCTSLTSVTIPNSVTSIGDYAFEYCTDLTNITIPNSVTSIGIGAFFKCSSLTSITIPKSVTSIGPSAFSNCSNLASIAIKKSLYEKCKNAFLNISSDKFRFYYDLKYTTDGNGSVTGPSDTFDSSAETLTMSPGTDYATDKVTWSDGVGEPVELKAVNGKYTMPKPSASFDYGSDTVTISVTFRKVNHEITFKNYDGTVLEKKKVPEGEIPEYTGTIVPSKPSAGGYSYEFAGWDTAPVAVTGPATYTATYTRKEIEYEITFKNYDGTVLEKKNVPYGDVPSYTGTIVPSKPSSGGYSFEFAGWDTAPVAVTGPATYTATYTRKEIEYKVTFVDDDGVEICSDTVKYHEVPVFNGNNPVRKETDTHTFTFVGWSDGKTTYSLDQGLPQIESDTTFTPVFNPVVKPVYTVVEVKGDGQNSDIVIDVHRNVDDENCITYFLGATIDGTEMKANDQYTATKGSTIITIKKDYLSTLSAGEHEVQVVFNDGSVSTKVTVAAKPSLPATGESTGTSTYIGLALVVAACVCGTGVILLKKRKEA